MASSCLPFWLFGKGSFSSLANFWHLSRTNIERIRELIAHEEPLNPHQCRGMSSMLERTVRSIDCIIDGVDDMSVVCGSAALENFYRVSEKGKQLVDNCCSRDWWLASAFQIQNEEAFKEVFLETSLCYNSIWTVVEGMNCRKEFLYEDLRETSTFDPPSADEVFKDRVALQGRLKDLVNDANFSSRHIRSHYLGKYLLGRVNWALQRSNDEDFDVRSFNLWSDGNGPDKEWGEKQILLGGNVCKTTWLDVPCAKKLFQDEMQEHEWLAEAKILASLNHPNIVKFLCCNKYETEHTRGHFIAMEQMHTNLGSFIKRLKEAGAKLSLFLTLDIILQIAYGMCYLHGHGIAHRDLKTSNVVVSRASTPQLQYYLQVKVVDFGISKVKLSQDKSNTMTKPKIGTTLYMPPEAFSNGRANWFKADVYSFSMVCSVILSGSEPFQDIMRREVGGAICSGRRPVLPEDIPKELALVITDGWCMDRNLRPTFVDICTRLEKLRHRLLRSHDSSELSLKQELDSNLYIERMLKRRSEARAHDRSAFHPTKDEPEWFDGDEEQQLILKLEQSLPLEGAGIATSAADGFQAGPPGLQELEQTFDYAGGLRGFDGDEEQQLILKLEQSLPQEGARIATTAADGFQAGPPDLQVLEQTFDWLWGFDGYESHGSEIVPSYSQRPASPGPQLRTGRRSLDSGVSSPHYGGVRDHDGHPDGSYDQQTSADGGAIVPRESDNGRPNEIFDDLDGDYLSYDGENLRGDLLLDIPDFRFTSPLSPSSPEEPDSPSFEDIDPLPGIVGLRIVGDAVLGGRLTYSCKGFINGTSRCLFQWVRHRQFGRSSIIEGATQPEYTITADDCDRRIAVECVPMDERGRRGDLVKAMANDRNWISQDSMMQDQINSFMAHGQAFFEVILLIQEGTSEDLSEPATLVLGRSNFELRRNSSRKVTINEKYAPGDLHLSSPVAEINIPIGELLRCVISVEGGRRKCLLEFCDPRARDTAVLAFRAFCKAIAPPPPKYFLEKFIDELDDMIYSGCFSCPNRQIA